MQLYKAFKYVKTKLLAKKQYLPQKILKLLQLKWGNKAFYKQISLPILGKFHLFFRYIQGK
jgi:hypothetical protein